MESCQSSKYHIMGHILCVYHSSDGIHHWNYWWCLRISSVYSVQSKSAILFFAFAFVLYASLKFWVLNKDYLLTFSYKSNLIMKYSLITVDSVFFLKTKSSLKRKKEDNLAWMALNYINFKFTWDTRNYLPVFNWVWI